MNNFCKTHNLPSWGVYFDRQGKPMCCAIGWSEKFEDFDYKSLAKNESATHVVSTIWLGINHNWSGGKPLIFETMVFEKTETGKVDYNQIDMERYTTEKQALRGHKKYVKMYLHP